ncbi:hypothetical protein AURDEDRAFT_178644 [Auricularia subglabra TFB-10046 SS5]|uniref:Uncharacterized protein n=1 Tax=Auricularia subglabra (strain TFB-10046 / SS5) TaxID=717982 RepID=J0WKL8_AURST|nr:hypothetical protein AURDEDRAFT_178644 [Auricularia subglabra TFB-10046 SS5]
MPSKIQGIEYIRKLRVRASVKLSYNDVDHSDHFAFHPVDRIPVSLLRAFLAGAHPREAISSNAFRAGDTLYPSQAYVDHAVLSTLKTLQDANPSAFDADYESEILASRVDFSLFPPYHAPPTHILRLMSSDLSTSACLSHSVSIGLPDVSFPTSPDISASQLTALLCNIFGPHLDHLRPELYVHLALSPCRLVALTAI